MATKEQIQRVLSIGIVADESEAIRALRRMDAAIKTTSDKTGEFSKSMKVLNAEYKAGAVSSETYARAMDHLAASQQKHIDKTNALIAANAKLLASQKAISQAQMLKDANARSAASALIAGRQVDPGGYYDLSAGQYVPLHAQVEQQRAAQLARSRQQQLMRDANARQAARDLMAGPQVDRGGYYDMATGQYVPLQAQVDQQRAAQAARARQQQAIQDANARQAARDLTAGPPVDQGGYYDMNTGQYVPIRAQVERERAERDDLRRRGGRYLQQFETDGDTRRRRVGEADHFHRIGAITGERHSAVVRKINWEYSQLNKTLGSIRGVAGTVFGPLSMTMAGGAFLYKSYQTIAEYERNMARMTALSGSRGAALGVAGGIRDISASSPMSFSAGMKAASTYMQYGGSAQTAPGVIKSFAAITGGDSDSMDRMALAYSQVRGAGRLMAQELNQMINAGFNPLMIISEKTGESMATLKKRMQDGGISFREVAEAFKAATGEGGKFGGMLAQMADTLPGRFQRMNTELEKMMIGDGNGGGVGKWLATAGQQVLAGMNIASGMDDNRSFLQRKSDTFDLLGTTFNSELDQALKHKGQLGRLLDLEKDSPELLTGPQRKLIKMFRGAQASDKERMWTEAHETDPDTILARISQHDKVVAGGDEIEIAKDYVDMVNAMGGMHFNSLENRRKYGSSNRLLEENDIQTAETNRLKMIFTEGKGKLLEKVITGTYGSKSKLVDLMREAIPPKDLEVFDAKIRGGASYGDLYGTLPGAVKTGIDDAAKDSSTLERLKAEEDFADAIERHNKEKNKQRAEFHNDLVNVRMEIKYKEDLVRLGREEAEILRIMSERKVGRTEAEAMRGAQRRLELMSDLPSVGNASAPRAMQAGSQEAYASIANSQAQAVSAQIRMMQEQLRKQQLQLAAAERTNHLLDKMESV